MGDSSTSDETDYPEAGSEPTTESNATAQLSTPPAVLERDEVFAALAHQRRRYLLYALVNENSEETLSELAVKIAAWEENKSPTEITDEERDPVRISLYHFHIPKLADFGILESHQAEDTIIRAKDTEQVEAVLGFADGEEGAREQTHTKGINADEN